MTVSFYMGYHLTWYKHWTICIFTVFKYMGVAWPAKSFPFLDEASVALSHPHD